MWSGSMHNFKVKELLWIVKCICMLSFPTLLHQLEHVCSAVLHEAFCATYPMAESCYNVMGNCLLYFEESRSKVQSSEVYARIRRLTEWPKKRDFVFYLTFWNSFKFYYLKFQYITFMVITSINHGNKISRSLVFLVKQSRFFCWKALGFS